MQVLVKHQNTSISYKYFFIFLSTSRYYKKYNSSVILRNTLYQLIDLQQANQNQVGIIIDKLGV